MIEHLADLEDPRLTPYRALKEGDLVLRQGLFIAEGITVVERLLLGSRYRARSLVLTEPKREALEARVGAPLPAPTYVLSQDLMDELVGFPIHRGCLALGERGALPGAAELLAAARTALVLVGLSNHDNVGSLFRSAIALGADAVLLDEESADPLYRKAIRVSMGAALTLPFARVQRAALPGLLAAAGYDSWALTPAGEPRVGPVRGKVALLLGTEGTGLPASLIDQATLRLRIDMSPGVDSLNVGVAGAIALFLLRSAREQGQ